MAFSEIPTHAQILIIGGGPAGSYAAATLAREGKDVVLLDMSKFPRYHIGESLLPSVRHYLRFIDAEDKIASHGFTRKPGSAIKFNQYMREGYTDFVALGASNNAWNVVRSEFDQLLLQHASSSGAHVFHQTKVESLQFAAESGPSQQYSTAEHSSSAYRSKSSSSSVEFAEMGRPVKALYTSTTGAKGEISFDYLIDASGRAGLLSTKYLKNRSYNQSLKNVAVWGYWRGTDMYGKDTSRENAPFFEALSDESGWAWFIPLHNGLTSVGVVMDQKQLGIRSRAASSVTSAPLPASPSSSQPSSRLHSTLADRYLIFLHLAPGVQALIGENATLECVCDENGDAPAARSASDFSYSAEEYAGNGWRIAGDAGAFIDPFFSSGVHLAMTGALSAAASVSASIRGDCTEQEAAMWHSKRVAISYTRFLVVVLSAYKQIRAQSTNVLHDIDDDSFDKAFAFFRPVIQGGADMGARLSEDEVQRALDFCVNLFSPTTPEQHESVRRKLLESQWWPSEYDELSGLEGRNPNSTVSQPGSCAERLLDVRAPIIDPNSLAKFLRTRLSLLRRNSFPPTASSPPPSPSSFSSSVFTSFFNSSSSDLDTRSDGGTEPEVECEGGDEEMRMVLEKVNARRVIHAEHGEGLNSLEEEAVCGLVVRLVRGNLGLNRVKVGVL